MKKMFSSQKSSQRVPKTLSSVVFGALDYTGWVMVNNYVHFSSREQECEKFLEVFFFFL